MNKLMTIAMICVAGILSIGGGSQAATKSGLADGWKAADVDKK